MKITVNIYNKQKAVNITNNIKLLIKKACRSTLKYEGLKGDFEISVVITDNPGIKELNKDYRNIDRETDVLSFPLCENGAFEADPFNGSCCLGDIVISAEKAVEQGKLYGHGNEREFAFLTVHSMLHLLGYDHVNSKDEEKIMFSKQEEILDLMGLSVDKG